MSFLHQHHSSSVMHFKKKWLQQQRDTASSNHGLPHSSIIDNSLRRKDLTPSGFISAGLAESPREAAPQHRNMPSSESVLPQGDLLRSARSHAQERHAIALNIPRFPRYGLPSQFSADSSLLSGSTAAGPDLPWLISRSTESFHLQLDELGDGRCTPSQKASAEDRFMIDINKPPPSPTHSMDSELAPSTPCSAPAMEAGIRTPPSFHLPVMDYSIPASPGSAGCLPRAGSDKLTSSSAPRRRPHSAGGLLHLPHLSPRTSELPYRATDLSLKMSGRQGPSPPPLVEENFNKSSPTSVLRKVCTPQMARKPRSGPWHAVDEATFPAMVQQRYASRMMLESARRGGQESHEDDEADAADDEEEMSGDHDVRGCKREGSEEEHLSKSGMPKACLHCGTTKTPLWRNGPPGPKSLCNACGIRFNKIRSGKRKPTPKEASMLHKYERSNSMTSNHSDLVNCSAPEGKSPLSQQRSMVTLPVATAHKSRTKLSQHRQSSVASISMYAPLEEKKRARSTEAGSVGEEDDELEGRPLRVAYQPRLKRPCIEPGEPSLQLPACSPAKMWRASVFTKEPIASPSKSDGEQDEEASSSDHESCLSEPPQSPPGSPRAAEKSHCVERCSWEEAPEDAEPRDLACWEGSEDGANDVEVGARLLMEIFHSAPAAVDC